MQQRKILDIDPSKCTGCRLCELVCSITKEGKYSPSLSRVRVMREFKAALDMPIMCVHCENPPCIDVCPVGAMKRDDDTGAVIIDTEACVGCKACMVVCLYGAFSVDVHRKMLLKCDLCGGEPKCVKYCPTEAIIYRPSEEASMKRKRLAMKKFILKKFE